MGVVKPPVPGLEHLLTVFSEEGKPPQERRRVVSQRVELQRNAHPSKDVLKRGAQAKRSSLKGRNLICRDIVRPVERPDK